MRDTIRVSGLPIRLLLGEAKLEGLIEEARGAGNAILGVARHSTAYYSPGAAAATLIEAVVRNTHAALPVSMVCEGEYGVCGLSVGILTQIGRGGVEWVVDVPLSAVEREMFEDAAAQLRRAWEQVCEASRGE